MRTRLTAMVLTLTCLFGMVGLVVSSACQEKKRRDVDKVKRPIPSPVQRALAELPPAQAAPLDPGQDRHALNRHLARLKNAPSAAAEAREIEALVAWLKRRKVAKYFEVTLGIRCPRLTDEELLALSSWSMARLTLTGYVKAPIASWRRITFKDPKNLLRLIPLAAPTRGGQPVKR